MSDYQSYSVFHDDESNVSIPSNLADASGVRIQFGHSIVADAFTGQVTEQGHASLNAGHQLPTADGLTFTSKSGSPLGGRAAQPSDIVRLPNGMDTTFEVALRSGLVDSSGRLIGDTFDPFTAETAGSRSKPSDGRPAGQLVPRGYGFTVPTPAHLNAPAEAAEETADPGEVLEGEAEAILSDFIPKTQAGSQIAVMVDVLDKGTVSDQSIGRIATEAGITPTEAREKVDAVVQGFRAQAAKAVSDVSSDPEAVFAWAQQHAPKALEQAIQTMTMERSTAGFRELGQRYLASADHHSPELVSSLPWKDGVRVAKALDGSLEIHDAQGRSHSWRSLVQPGDFSALING